MKRATQQDSISNSENLERHSTFLTWLSDQNVPVKRALSCPVIEGLIASPASSLIREQKQYLDDSDSIRVLMLLCQKIGSTGSGIVVKELIDRAPSVGVEYSIMCGGYADDNLTDLFTRQPAIFEQLLFNSNLPETIPFPIVGMSNRMPYDSVAFKDLSFDDLCRYSSAWATKIGVAVNTFRPHVIHVHHLWLLAAVAALIAPEIPVIVSVHGTDLFRAQDSPHIHSLVVPWSVRFEKILTLSEQSSKTAKLLYALEDNRIEVYGNGFNEELFHPGREAPKEFVRQYNLQSLIDKHVVLFVGKYEQWKGIEWLIRAFAKVHSIDEYDSQLLIIGSGPEEQLHDYTNLVEILGLQDKVLFTGAVPYEQVGIFMNLAHVFVLPAFNEPFGLVILEALACGCRIVTTDQGGPFEFVPSELRKCGDARLVPGLSTLNPEPIEAERFVDDLARAIISHLAQPLEIKNRLQIADSIRHLTWDSYTQRLGKLYKSLSVSNNESR